MAYISRVNPELPKLFLENGQIRIVDFKGSDYQKTIAKKKEEISLHAKLGRVFLGFAITFFVFAVSQLFLDWLSGGKIGVLFAFTFIFAIITAFNFALSSDAQTVHSKLEDELNIIRHEFQPELMELEKQAAVHRAELAQIEHPQKFNFQREAVL